MWLGDPKYITNIDPEQWLINYCFSIPSILSSNNLYLNWWIVQEYGSNNLYFLFILNKYNYYFKILQF